MSVGVDSNSPAHPTGVTYQESALLTIQLALVLGVAIWFKVELERGFATVAVLTLPGFIIHSWLPVSLRPPFHLLLTGTALTLLLHADALWLALLGLLLLALCHVPVAWSLRVVGILIVAGVLAAARADQINLQWSDTVLPILASIFMFRIILYMYNLKTENTQTTIWQRLAYFFMLPNICFPLFPVVDYDNFLRSYYDAPASKIYQKGINWIFRGIIQLLGYRVIYYLLPRVDASELGVIAVFLFMAMTYGLYLRVSGLFHIITGILALFGYNLTRTNNNYFLASSFTDLWRRINIYWKDFMMKIVFYPTFQGLRKRSMAQRLVISTFCVFLVTWFLHSYQWFWLRGSFPVLGTDMVFWGVLGVLLAANTVMEAQSGRKRDETVRTFRGAAVTSLSTILVFSTMAVLWSLWYSGSFSEWLYRLLRIRETSPKEWLVFGSLLLTIGFVAAGLRYLSAQRLSLRGLEDTLAYRAAVIVPITSALILLIGVSAMDAQLGSMTTRLVLKVRSTGPNTIDLENQERGYYESLTRATQFDVLSVGGLQLQDENWIGFRNTPAVSKTSDLRGWTLKPHISMRHKGVLFETNSLGIRDRPYSVRKGGGVYRIAVVGSSHVMGSGVDNDETFENVLEDELNIEGKRKYEVLNFGTGGYGPFQTLYVIEHVVPSIEPDEVLYFVMPGEVRRTIDRLSELDETFTFETDYEFVSTVMAEAGAHFGLPANEFKRRLEPFSNDLLKWIYDRQVVLAQDMGASITFVLLPLVNRKFERREKAQLIHLIEGTNSQVFDLSDVYKGYDAKTLMISAWDGHPNEAGHRLIADRLLYSLPERPTARPLEDGL